MEQTVTCPIYIGALIDHPINIPYVHNMYLYPNDYSSSITFSFMFRVVQKGVEVDAPVSTLINQIITTNYQKRLDDSFSRD